MDRTGSLAQKTNLNEDLMSKAKPKPPAAKPVMLERPLERQISPRERGTFLSTAHDLADTAGAAILPHFRKSVAVTNKAAKGFDPVTIADKAAEKAMRKALALAHPEHGIVGEEFADHNSSGRFRWILDPIDGTRAFIMGYPLWGTLIGLADGDQMVVGMMDQPYTRERFWATDPGPGKGPAGASFRGADGKIKKLKTRACTSLSDAILACTTMEMFKSTHERVAFLEVSSRVRMTRFGGDCYAYCLLAAGQIDLVIEASLKAVDIAPLVPIIEQAGGVVTNWAGGSAMHGGRVIAAGDPKLHALALKFLANERSDTMMA
jgi:histidinol phosphatase-like enzyme (inositol monophosphatase family)